MPDCKSSARKRPRQQSERNNLLSEKLQLPRIYPIIDAAQFRNSARPLDALLRFSEELMESGAT